MQITLVGAGSLEFCAPLLRSLLPVAERHHARIVLCDRDAVAFDEMLAITRRLATAQDLAVAVDGEPSMPAAVADADYVILTLNNGGHGTDQRDFANAFDHGILSKHIDTIGPGAWLRALRQGALCHELLTAMRPDATLLNLSNPLAFLGRMAVRSGRRFVGFCHGPATRVRTIAGWLGLDQEPEYSVFGTNHLSWLTSLRQGGEDLRPWLLAYLQSDRAPAGWRLNRELLERLGTMPVLEAQHTADFFPGLNDQAALDAYGLHTWDPSPQTNALRQRLEKRAALAAGTLGIDQVRPSPEGVELVLDALAGGTPHSGVYNAALAEPANGMPEASVAECWMTIDAGGCHLDTPPALPDEVCEQLARLAKQQDLAAEACESAAPAKLIEAMRLEPNLPQPEVADRMVARALAEHRVLLGDRWASSAAAR